MSSLDQRIFDSSHVRSSDVSLDHHLVLTCHWSQYTQYTSGFQFHISFPIHSASSSTDSGHFPKNTFFLLYGLVEAKKPKTTFSGTISPFPATVRIGLNTTTSWTEKATHQSQSSSRDPSLGLPSGMRKFRFPKILVVRF